MIQGQQEEQIEDFPLPPELLELKLKEQSPDDLSPLKLSFCSQSPLTRSTYYQTKHSTTTTLSFSPKKWTSPRVSAGSRMLFHHKQSIPKPSSIYNPLLGTELQSPPKIFNRGNNYQSIRQNNNLRLRMVRPTPCLLDLRPCVSASSYYSTWSDSSQPLLCSNESEKRQIASLTKIMTAYTVLALCRQYNIKVREQWIPIHTRASYMEGTTANLRSGQEILLVDLLYGLLLPSGNDAGIAMAQFFGKFLSFKLTKENTMDRYSPNVESFNECKGFYDQQYERQSIKLFVFEMNRQAQLLGLKSTYFDNPTGLTNKDNYSTAKDIGLLTSICLQNHLLRLIFRKKVHKCEVRNDKLGYNRQVMWQNTNKHLYQIKQCLGVKTGITPGAGPCLSAAYRVGSRELVVVVLNCQDRQTRYEDVEKIYRWCRRQTIVK